MFLQIYCSEHKNGFLHFCLLPLLLFCPFGSNSALHLHTLLSRVFHCSVCHCILVSPYCTVLAFSSPQLLISHRKKSWSLDPWCVQLLGTAEEDWWPCGCFAVRARKQVCSFVFHCHRQPPCGHRTAHKMKHVAFRKTLRWNNRPCARFHLKQNVALQRPLRLFHRCGKKTARAR